MPRKSKAPKKSRTASKTTSASGPKSGDRVRLQKFLAQAGQGSRRECEELILEGRVTVDGQVIQKHGVQIDPETAKVTVDGTRVNATRMQYFIVNKPVGVLSTCSDPDGRMRVIDLINTDQRVYNVGRLDKSSEGLILVTNDGDLANRLTHPRYGVQKTYLVTVAGSPNWEDLQMLKRGVRLAEAVAQVTDIDIKKRRRDSCDLVIVLNEGRNREIRRLLAHIGHKVIRLRRIAIGSLQLDDLQPGAHRRLNLREIEGLRNDSAMIKGKRPRRGRPVESSQLPGRRKKKAAGDAATSPQGKKFLDKAAGNPDDDSDDGYPGGKSGRPGSRTKKFARKGAVKRNVAASRKKKAPGKKRARGNSSSIEETGSRRGEGRVKKKTRRTKSVKKATSKKKAGRVTKVSRGKVGKSKPGKKPRGKRR